MKKLDAVNRATQIKVVDSGYCFRGRRIYLGAESKYPNLGGGNRKAVQQFKVYLDKCARAWARGGL